MAFIRKGRVQTELDDVNVTLVVMDVASAWVVGAMVTLGTMTLVANSIEAAEIIAERVKLKKAVQNLSRILREQTAKFKNKEE